MPLNILFVNEYPPEEKKIGATRLREFACALSQQNHRVLLFTTTSPHLSTIGNTHQPHQVPLLIQQHDWKTPLMIGCQRKPSFLLECVRKNTIPSFFRKMLVCFYFIFSQGVSADWQRGSKPFWKPLVSAFLPDIVIGTFGKSDCLVIAKKIAHIAKVPWVIDIKDSWENFIPYFFRHYLANFFSDAAMITLLAQFYAKDAIQFFPKIPTHVIYSGFPAIPLQQPFILNDSAKSYKIFLVGSCYHEQYVRLLLDGILLFTQQQDHVEVHYVGGDFALVNHAWVLLKDKVPTVNHGMLSFNQYASLVNEQASVLCYIHSDVTFHHKSIELLMFQKPIICVPHEHAEAVNMAQCANIPFFQCDQPQAVAQALFDSAHAMDHVANTEYINSLSWEIQAKHLSDLLVETVLKNNKGA